MLPLLAALLAVFTLSGVLARILARVEFGWYVLSGHPLQSPSV
jgi:hypothetical protein